MKVVVTGGGTGGHIYPAIAVAQRIMRDHPGSQVLYAGSPKGPEREAARRAGLEFFAMETGGVLGKSLPGVVRSLVLFTMGFIRALFKLSRYRPQCVVGTGGYASAPACFAAVVLGIPCVVHEMNYHPGMVTRRLARRAAAVAVAHPATAPMLPAGAKVVTTGVAVRSEIEELSDRDCLHRAREQAYAVKGISRGRKTLLVLGGSQGARAINRSVAEAIEVHADREDLQVIHLAGLKCSDDLPVEIRGREGGLNYCCLPYFEQISLLYAVSDLVVSRAGAGTLAELTAAGLPAVLVPFPYSVEGHQEENARRLEEIGAAKMVMQEGDSADGALEEAFRLLYDDPGLNAMKEAARSAAAGTGTGGIVSLVEGIVGAGDGPACRRPGHGGST